MITYPLKGTACPPAPQLFWSSPLRSLAFVGRSAPSNSGGLRSPSSPKRPLNTPYTPQRTPKPSLQFWGATLPQLPKITFERPLHAPKDPQTISDDPQALQNTPDDPKLNPYWHPSQQHRKKRRNQKHNFVPV